MDSLLSGLTMFENFNDIIPFILLVSVTLLFWATLFVVHRYYK